MVSLQEECTILKKKTLALNKANNSLQDKLSAVSDDLEEAIKCIADVKENIAQSEVKINHDIKFRF